MRDGTSVHTQVLLRTEVFCVWGKRRQSNFKSSRGTSRAQIYSDARILSIGGSRFLRGVPGGGLLPPGALAKIDDVGHVMASVPGVERDIFLQAHQLEFGMAEGSLPVFRFHRTQKAHPAVVQGIKQSQ